MKAAVIEALIGSSQKTPFRGRGAYGADSSQTKASDPTTRFAQAFTEASIVDRFYLHFPDLPDAIKGKAVLDFGCGYGGKTVEYGKLAATVAGIEPFPNVIALAQGYKDHLRADNVEFKVCAQDEIPYPDASFDVVLSHDVLEHVDNPEISLREIARVLKPGGVAYIVCPPYDGAFSHHLDYLTLLPGLHWFFSADTLIAAVNRILATSKLGMSPQPTPKLSWSGDRKVLPFLNGLTGPQFERLARGLFDRAEIRFHPIGFGKAHPFARMVRTVLTPVAALGPGLRDRVTFSIAGKLTKKA